MDFGLVISFIQASILLTLMPGPDNIYVLTESISKGARNGIAISTGLSSGILIHTLVVSTSLALVIQQSEVLFTIIKLLGVGYLFYLAWMTFKEKIHLINLKDESAVKKIHFFKLFKKGFLMNILNPKVSLFFIAFLPAFVSKEGLSPSYQMMILGSIFMVQAFILFSAISLLSSVLKKYLRNERFWHITKWTQVVVLVLIGVFLATSTK